MLFIAYDGSAHFYIMYLWQPQMLKSQIAKAHCSIGELYLTDLCYDDDAEAKCEEAINKAIAVDQNSLDGQQGTEEEPHLTSSLTI